MVRPSRWAALLGALVVGACAGEHPQSTIDPSSDFAATIQSLYVSVFWWTMLILAVVWSVLAYVLIRFREKKGDPLPRPIRGHLGIEVAWTVAPALIVLAIAIPTIRAVFATQRPASEDALLVEVTGHRFWFEFNYPTLGVRTANELHVPLNRPLSLRLSASDVVHSFWVPALGGKRDLNPLVAGREGDAAYTWLHFTPSEPGVFMGQCAEYCGVAHSLMGVRVIVESEEEFAEWGSRWLTGGGGGTSEDPLVTRGRQIFLTESTCIVCHSISGTLAQGRIGPDLSLFGTRGTLGAGRLENTPDNLARWIRDPQGVKPGAEMPGTTYPLEGGTGPLPTWPATGLDDQQVAAVAAYLSSLR